MFKNLKKKESGFTIIEVLIVLAIAGLILLIVFLAVPALQRNSRNTAIKNDAQNVLGGVSEYMGANDGALPLDVSGTGTIAYTGGANTTEIKVQGSTVVMTVPSAPGTVPGGEVHVVLRARCDGSTSARAVAAYYSIETASNPTVLQCAES